MSQMLEPADPSLMDALASPSDDLSLQLSEMVHGGDVAAVSGAGSQQLETSSSSSADTGVIIGEWVASGAVGRNED
eukprot:12909067-Prorocentrum_lima.AAC.1